MLVMDKNLEPQSKVSESNPMETKTGHEEKSNKCNQCDFASAHAGSLRTHLKMHTGEKSNNCYQCEYESVVSTW